MSRSASTALGVFLLAGAHHVSAQQVNPRVPPPPPPAEAPAAPAAVPAAARQPESSSAATPASDATSVPTPPIDPTVPPLPPTEDSVADVPAAPSGPVFDPLHAQRSIDIGTFYLHKGVYDAAIERFTDATNYQPTLAAPWKLLGEAYEKKHEYAKAAEAYNKYLRVLPRAADAAKIRKGVSDLEEKAAAESPKH